LLKKTDNSNPNEYYYGIPQGLGCTLYSRLIKTTAKKPLNNLLNHRYAKRITFLVFENKKQEQTQSQTKAESKNGVHKTVINFRRF
jgi:hypothetical protein